MAWLSLSDDNNALPPPVFVQVKAFIVETMAYQNHLRGGVIFIEKIPKSRIGKILRAELRKMVKEKIEAGELKQG